MMMKSIRTLGLGITLLGLLAGLTGCGGGGGGGAAERPVPVSITIEIQDPTLLTNGGEITYEAGTDFATNVTITVRNSDGSVVVNGTSVALSVSSSALGLLSSTTDLFTQDDNINLATSSGIAQAVFHTRGLTGTVQLTASVLDQNANQNVSRSASIDIAQGPPPVRRITLTATKASVPARPPSVPVFFDSPYMAEINIEYRERDGTLGSPAGGEVGVAINPVSLAAFSTLDDPDTEDVDEFFVLLGNGPVELAGGQGKVFVHPFDTAGSVTISVSGQDNTTNQVFDATFEVTINEPASDGRPGNVQFLLPGTPQYIQGSGGINAQSFQVFVTDGGEEPVPNPGGSNNNVFLQIIGEQPNSGEVLRGVSASGSAVEGTSINLATTSGITSASLVSGTEPGLFRLRAVADAADNNVSNGIQGPVESEVGVVISDGVPHSITLTTFPINSLSVNPVSPDVGFDMNGFPLDPNATYSLRVSALVTDRFGNPPAQPTALQLGLVDAPLIGFPDQGPGFFGVSGGDGNPTEGGTSFFAPSGVFQTGGGGVGPNDTLILFGKDVTGNADLESARTITQVVNQTNLVVDEPFNRNDTTGSPVNNGSVIPYLAGRAQTANIESNVVTDAVGVASSFLNYPVSQLGRAAAIYIQGTNGPISGSGFIRTYADAELIRYPGLAPAVLTATPNQIPANSTNSILVCYTDAAAVPIQGQFIGFAFSLASGQGTVDGFSDGVVQQPTGSDGCTVAVVTTSGILPEGAADNMLTFFVGGATAVVEIAEPGEAVLQAQPSAILGNGTRTILLRLFDSGGNGVQGAAITGSCTVSEGSAIITQQPDLTDANGETQAVIQTAGLQVCSDEATGSVGSCTFEAAGGTPSAIVELFPQVFTSGLDFSPAGPDCTAAPGP